jgi:hypothetical protein
MSAPVATLCEQNDRFSRLINVLRSISMTQGQLTFSTGIGFWKGVATLQGFRVSMYTMCTCGIVRVIVNELESVMEAWKVATGDEDHHDWRSS